MADETKPAPLSYASFIGPSVRGRGFLAVCGTVVFAGVGHWLARSYRRGLVWMGISLALTALGIFALLMPRLIPMLRVILPVSGVISIWILVDAYRVGRRSSPRILKSAWMRYAAGMILLVAAEFMQLGVVGIVRHFVGSYAVGSGAMNPALVVGERFISVKTRQPVRWDVVTYHPPTQPGQIYVARVAGLPGETVEIRSDGLLIDGKSMSLPAGVGPYTLLPLHVGNGCEGNPIHLGEGEYFVLGDNSKLAFDARYWEVSSPWHQVGALPRDQIEGVVTAVYWPMGRARRLAE